LEENNFLEAKIVAKTKEEEKREIILTRNIKEIFKDIKKIEAEFGQK
jgi:hypothetical protein